MWQPELLNFLAIVLGALSATFTFKLNNDFKFGPVTASALVSLLGGLLFHYWPEILFKDVSETMPAIIMGCSFIGMASRNIISRSWIIAIAGILFALIFLFTNTYFEGFGGSLGTIAAISLIVIFILQKFLRNFLQSAFKR